MRPADSLAGNPEAAVVVVDFSDLECGYCKRVSAQLVQLYPVYEDRVLFVAKSFAMDPGCNPGVNNRRHRHACQGERAQECARRQQRFWAFHEIAFKNQHELDDEALRLYARTAGLDLIEYDRCMADDSSLQAVAADGEDGKSLGISGTPRLYINGKLYRGGRSAEQIARAIELALGTAPSEVPAGTSGASIRTPMASPLPTRRYGPRWKPGEAAHRGET